MWINISSHLSVCFHKYWLNICVTICVYNKLHTVVVFVVVFSCRCSSSIVLSHCISLFLVHSLVWVSYLLVCLPARSLIAYLNSICMKWDDWRASTNCYKTRFSFSKIQLQREKEEGEEDGEKKRSNQMKYSNITHTHTLSQIIFRVRDPPSNGEYAHY